jgi:rare lipoprotein A
LPLRSQRAPLAAPARGRTRYVYADGAAPAASPSGIAAPGFRTPAAGPGERTQLARHQKVGAPYQVGGVWYLPAFEPDFDETGTASWYGSEFHGRPTSNGEVFDMNALTAAHPTLPLPSLLEVTNLANGKTITVRLNDRGPFVGGRMLDLSRRAAEELGFIPTGTAQVRVRYLGPAEPAAPAIPSVTLASARTPAAVAAVSAPLLASVTPVAAGRFVQAGAFADEANAERARERVAGLGPTRVAPATINGARMFRVLLGPWANEAEASAKADEVAARGLPGARVLATIAD